MIGGLLLTSSSEKYAEAHNLLRTHCFENKHLQLLILFPEKIHQECEKLMRIHKCLHSKAHVSITERLVLMIRTSDIEMYAKEDFDKFRVHLMNFLMHASTSSSCCFFSCFFESSHGYFQLKEEEEMVEMKAEDEIGKICDYSFKHYLYNAELRKHVYVVEVSLCPAFLFSIKTKL